MLPCILTPTDDIGNHGTLVSRPDGSFVFYDNATSTLMAIDDPTAATPVFSVVAVLPWSSLLANDGATGGF